MAPRVRSRLVVKRTRRERVAQRQAIQLEEAALSDNTRTRYFNALQKLIPVLLSVQHIAALDYAVSEWIENMWFQGEPQYTISDAFCGFHYFEPWSKGKIPASWRLFGIWRKLEVPTRAAPLTAELVRSLAMYAIEHHDLAFALLILLGFYGLLRTGELLHLLASDLLCHEQHLLVSLKDTKSGKRKAAQEMIHLEDTFTIEVAQTFLELRRSQNALACPIWRFSGQAFRNRFNHYCNRFDLGKFLFRPYSLRRGGATHHFQETRSMESALLLGRWESARVAKIYISDGLLFLPGMTFTSKTKAMLQRFAPPL